MDEDADAGRGEWCPVEVEGAVELGPGRELGVQAGTTEEVQGDDCLGDEAVPQVEREVFVDAAEARDEVVFERANGAFGGVASVDAGRDKLVVNVLCDHELFERVGAFVV